MISTFCVEILIVSNQQFEKYFFLQKKMHLVCERLLLADILLLNANITLLV